MTNNDELERQAFESWFHREWWLKLANMKLPSMQRRQLMQMGWYAWQARANLEKIHG